MDAIFVYMSKERTPPSLTPLRFVDPLKGPCNNDKHYSLKDERLAWLTTVNHASHRVHIIDVVVRSRDNTFKPRFLVSYQKIRQGDPRLLFGLREYVASLINLAFVTHKAAT